MKKELDHRYEICEGRIAFLEDMAKHYQEKLKEAKNDLEKTRVAIKEYMEKNGIMSDNEGIYTYSIKRVPPKPVIIDESKIPDDYWRVVKSIDKAKINAAFKSGQDIEGCQLDNGGETLAIKRK